MTYSAEQLRRAYTNAVAARLMDAKILILLKQGKIFFHIGGSGTRGDPGGMALALQPGKDWAYPYYRDMCFSLEFGFTVEEIMQDAMHRAGSISSGGFAMPFHYGAQGPADGGAVESDRHAVPAGCRHRHGCRARRDR